MPLPEFILKQIMVPGSFKFTHSGFGFALKNNFAPGTITGFKLLADGKEIPGRMVTLEGEGQSAVRAQMISTSSPVAFPTGILYSIRAEYPDKFSTLALWAETKEAGIIQFTAWKAPAPRGKLFRWPAFFRKPVRFNFAASDHQRKLNPVLAGLMVDLFPVPLKNIRDLKNLPLAVFPVPKPSKSHRSRISNEGDFSTDLQEILHLCRSQGTQVVFAINPPQTAPEAFTNWLLDFEVLNTVKQDPIHESDAFTHPEPPITVIIQGDAWQGWELSLTNAITYGRKIDDSCSLKQGWNSQLQLTALGKSLPSEDLEDVHYKWNLALLQTAGKSIDILYWQLPLFSKWIKSEPGTDQALTEMRDQFRKLIQRIDSQLAGVDQEKKPLQAIDLSHLSSSLECQVRNHTIELEPVDVALLLASLFMVVAENADKIAFSTLANLSKMAQNSSQLKVTWDILSSHSQNSVFETGINGNEAAGNHRVARSEDGKIEILATVYSKENLELLTILNHQSAQRVKVDLEQDPLIHKEMKELIQMKPKGEILQRNFQKPQKVRALVLPPRSILHCVLLHK